MFMSLTVKKQNYFKSRSKLVTSTLKTCQYKLIQTVFMWHFYIVISKNDDI